MFCLLLHDESRFCLSLLNFVVLTKGCFIRKWGKCCVLLVVEVCCCVILVFEVCFCSEKKNEMRIHCSEKRCGFVCWKENHSCFRLEERTDEVYWRLMVFFSAQWVFTSVFVDCCWVLVGHWRKFIFWACVSVERVSARFRTTLLDFLCACWKDSLTCNGATDLVD